MPSPRPIALLLLMLLPICHSTTIAQEILPDTLKLVIDGHSLPTGSYGLMVHEVGASGPMLAINSDAALNPASSMKTLTTLAALELLGPAWTWQTAVYAQGDIVDGTLQGDLLLRGGGDPYLLEEQFRNLLKAVRRAGIRNITGDLLIDDSLFAPEVSEEDMIDNQGARAYNVRPYALSLNFQAVTFWFSPHANGRDVVIESDPQLPNITIDNRLRLAAGACGGFQRGISFDADPVRPNTVVFSGRFPDACRQYSMVRSFMTPRDYALGLFTRLWTELGGEFTGQVSSARAPEDSEPLLVWDSPPLVDVIRYLNKYSNNLMARHLLLTLGAANGNVPATVSSGVAAMESWLESFGVDTRALVIDNGAGLSRQARISAASMNQILRYGYQRNLMPEFVSSLPIAGEDGTMRYRLAGVAETGAVHVKTGTLDEVSAVAGYVISRSGGVYAVSAFLNHELADRGPGVEFMDALLTWVSRQ
jgi:D-alanyl-D-alanine carboxypeptidase/D-alanyl-D-alanine-endopeptidase (penicillin-binding protein 4)